ncbi:hypothetical protein BT96DRAFT_998248 [Gymnopus androsaceus JB14]|uniref:Uncharacterized protein n=1 Tax=Gymnopus androsaceus JB14 TaxID=1447944 RepID=A0A6A4HAR9_9AGAR|nr:hypothetical protein BT96DRAFT_998248 [Gymnopus androsaceus JB14]
MREQRDRQDAEKAARHGHGRGRPRGTGRATRGWGRGQGRGGNRNIAFIEGSDGEESETSLSRDDIDSFDGEPLEILDDDEEEEGESTREEEEGIEDNVEKHHLLPPVYNTCSAKCWRT